MNGKNGFTKATIILLLTLLAVVCIGTLGFSAELAQNDISQIRQAALSLVSDDQTVKQNAVAVLDEYQTAAIPHLITVMRNNQGETAFVGYEIINYAAKYGEASIPVIRQGLNDINPNSRNSAALIAARMGEDAADLVQDIALLVADYNELTHVRSQGLAALRAIGVVNSDVYRALALANVGDTMLVWNTSQAIRSLGVAYDDLIPILFTELENNQYTHAFLTAIARNLRNTKDPMSHLTKALATPSDALTRQFFQFIDQLYPTLGQYQDDLIEVLFDQAVNGSTIIKEQAIYALGEVASSRNEIVDRFLTMATDSEIDPETFLWISYALEKTDSSNQAVISFFVDRLLDENSSEAVQLAATRYLEKSGLATIDQVVVLLDNLDKLDETVLWRLSPLFYNAAQNQEVLVEKIQALTNSNQSEHLQAYGHSILTALDVESDLDYLAIEFARDSDARTPAFPTAEGYGRYTVGGRGGDVYIVTNLNEQGPGSLRAAVEASGPRTVVFAVSGNIMLSQSLDINDPYITLAGQTAPGDGITIAGAPVNINSDQVIIRYLRFRLGDYNNYEADSIGGRYISDIILDHITASWAVDETVSFYETNNLTLQWSFITESLRGSGHVKGNHGYGGIWGGFSSFHYNLIAHHSSRNPRFDGERTLDDPATDMRNNVIYNWGFNSTYGGEGGNHNMIANYYKPGPGTGTGSVNHRIVEISNGGQWYIADNYVYGYPAITADNWNGGINLRTNSMDEVRTDTEFPVPYVTTRSAEEAFELVMEYGGAILPNRDSVDKRIVEEVRTGTSTYGGLVSGLDSGIIDSQDDVGGLPFLRSYSAPLDSDQDGIPDWWAIKYGFDPDGGLDHNDDLDGDGYTNLEEYLNGTNPLVADQH